MENVGHYWGVVTCRDDPKFNVIEVRLSPVKQP